jgi:hypothetical protein
LGTKKAKREERKKLPSGDFFVLLWFRLPLAKSRDKEKKGNKKKILVRGI